MCLSCGCDQPFSDHGDGRNITFPDVAGAAAAAAISVESAAANITTGVSQVNLGVDDDPTGSFLDTFSRPGLFFDIDGVLCFWLESALASLNAKYSLGLTVDQPAYWLESSLVADEAVWFTQLIGQPLFYYNVAPDFSGIEAVKAFHRAGFAVTIGSDRPTNTRTTTESWLERWSVPYDDLVINGAGGKKSFLDAKTTPYILFDDDPRKALTVPNDHIQVWSPQRPWTPTDWEAYPGYYVFDSWADVLEALGVSPNQPIPNFAY